MSLFKDETSIHCAGGRGGDGCLSFRHEALTPKGGPDGGNGGRGGSVILRASREVSSLLDLMRRRKIRAKNGQPGLGKNRFGSNGPDEILTVPLGTIVFSEDGSEQLADLTEEGEEFFVARGGKGGKGNKFYAHATNQVPQQHEDGRDGQERAVRLELKLIADVGLVGFPNAGKSTFLSSVSAAKPRIAAYPFTTLEPQLGIVRKNYVDLIIADIPGLIEGASEGRGLGHQFLRHIERTRVILHIVDLSDFDPEAQIERYRAIRRELESFSPTLASKPEILALNKFDTEESVESLEYFLEAIGDKEVYTMSGITGEGVDAVLAKLTKITKEAKAEELEAIAKAKREAISTQVDPDITEEFLATQEDD